LVGGECKMRGGGIQNRGRGVQVYKMGGGGGTGVHNGEEGGGTGVQNGGGGIQLKAIWAHHRGEIMPITARRNEGRS
jgi:hypothetical protein